MPSNRPDKYVDLTEMAHPARKPGGAALRGPTAAGARPALSNEQEAKRVEKIRSHASSHHTAGTVTLDVC